MQNGGERALQAARWDAQEEGVWPGLRGRGRAAAVRPSLCSTDCRDVLLPLVTDQLSGQLDDHSIKPDLEACVQLLATVLDILDRRDVVRRGWMWTWCQVWAPWLTLSSFRVPPGPTCS